MRCVACNAVAVANRMNHFKTIQYVDSTISSMKTKNGTDIWLLFLLFLFLFWSFALMMLTFADINECSTTHVCNTEISDCVNTEGNYRCECKTGYTQSATSDKVCTGKNCRFVNSADDQ